MQVLTPESLRYAVKQCQEIERYKVLIVVDNIRFDSSLLNYFNQSELLDWSISRNNTYFRFYNGSIIRCIDVSSNARGHKVHLVLCEQHMFKDNVMKQSLMAFEIINPDFKLTMEV